MVPSMIDKAGTPLEHSSASLGSRLWCAGALGTYSSITLWSGDMSLSKASSMTWTKDTIMMIEKTRTPIGSSLKSREVSLSQTLWCRGSPLSGREMRTHLLLPTGSIASMS